MATQSKQNNTLNSLNQAINNPLQQNTSPTTTNDDDLNDRKVPEQAINNNNDTDNGTGSGSSDEGKVLNSCKITPRNSPITKPQIQNTTPTTTNDDSSDDNDLRTGSPCPILPRNDPMNPIINNDDTCKCDAGMCILL